MMICKHRVSRSQRKMVPAQGQNTKTSTMYKTVPTKFERDFDNSQADFEPEEDLMKPSAISKSKEMSSNDGIPSLRGTPIMV